MILCCLHYARVLIAVVVVRRERDRKEQRVNVLAFAVLAVGGAV